MRFSTLAACVALVLLVLAPAASADAPSREVIPPGQDFMDGTCGYPILVHSEGTTIRMVFTDNQGEVVRQIEVYPGFRQVLTNLDTGETLTVVNPGPLMLRFNADGTTTFRGTGRGCGVQATQGPASPASSCCKETSVYSSTLTAT
jgi:hypothetical protein